MVSVVENAFSTLADIRVALASGDQIGCHVFVFSPRTRDRQEEWLKIAMNGAVADRIAEAARESILRLEGRATDDQALAEFDFDAMADGSIGVLALEGAPAIAEWLNKVPSDDWLPRFEGDEKALAKARFYVIRLNFSDGRTLTLFRGSRGLNVTLRARGMVAAAFSREKNEMVAIDGPVVSFDSVVDFFAWNDTVFIANLRTFESITNIREVTVKKSEEAIDALAEKFGFGENVELLKIEVGKRTILAKRLAAAHKNGVIDDINAENLVSRASQKNLRVKCKMENGNAVFDVNYNDKGEVQDLVDLLTDLFLQSPVTGREWEAIVKRAARPRRR